ncbi:unnamed protein product, partial [Ectocarpus sp. 12 AP-2014]
MELSSRKGHNTVRDPRHAKLPGGCIKKSLPHFFSFLLGGSFVLPSRVDSCLIFLINAPSAYERTNATNGCITGVSTGLECLQPSELRQTVHSALNARSKDDVNFQGYTSGHL